MIYFNLLLIAYINMYIINKSGIILDISKFVYTHLKKEEWNYQIITKPFSCANCMTFWISFFYLIFHFNILNSLAIALLNSSFIVDILEIVYNFVNKVLFNIKNKI